MAEVTVAELAKSVNVSVEHLLVQMKEAGLAHQKAEQFVSDEDKQILLSHLRSSHGEEADSPTRITLKRRTITKLKTGGAARRTVNVEIRKKRTYVKRDEEGGGEAVVEEGEGTEQELPVQGIAAEQQPEVVPVAEEVVAEVEERLIEAPGEPEAETVVEVAAVEAVPAPAEAAVAAEAPKREDKRMLDPELLRQAAAIRRKEKEAEERARREALAKAKKLKGEAKKQALEALMKKYAGTAAYKEASTMLADIRTKENPVKK